MMDWLQFLSLIAVPAYGAQIGLMIWAYRDLRSSVRFNENRNHETGKRLDADIAAIRLQIATDKLEALQRYVPRDELDKTERRILEAIAKLEKALDRHREDDDEGR
jgi:hypothetical protein